ncbi:MAG: hypothetical protein EXR75_17005, partial [Myxococcales bacterium]|nr:hypothetical protein [Myxococcales bacterium]
MTQQPTPRAVRPTARNLNVNDDQLAANVVVALHRLVKQSTLYTTENEAQLSVLQQMQAVVKEYGRRTGSNP